MVYRAKITCQDVQTTIRHKHSHGLYFVILTIVRSPDTREDMRSLPALAVTIVLCAPETAGVTKENLVSKLKVSKYFCKLHIVDIRQDLTRQKHTEHRQLSFVA